MISTISSKTEFDPVLRDPATLPIEFQVGNPFLPRNRLIVDPLGASTPSSFVSEELSSLPDLGEPAEPLKALLANQLRFSRVDNNRLPRNPHSLNNLAISEMNAGHLADAEQHFREAIALDADFFPAKAHLAKLFLLRRDYDSALGIYRELHSRRPDDRQLLLNMAAILIERGQLGEAEAQLKQLLAAAPDDPHTLGTFGILHLIQGRLRQAISSFRKSLNSNVRLISSHNNLGVAYVLSGNYRRAEREFKAMLALNANNHSAVKNLAELYLMTRRCDVAVPLLANFLRRNEADVEGRTLLALCLLTLEEYKDSLQQLNIAAKYANAFGLNSATLAKFNNNFGVIHHRLKDFGKAEEYYKQALNTEDPSRSTFCNMMSLYFEQKRLDDLRQTIERYSEAFPDDGWGKLFLSRYYVETGDYERALATAHEAASQLPRATAPFAVIGWMLTEVYGDYEGAIAAAQEGLARNAKDTRMLNNLAYAYLMAGDVSVASKILDRLDPKNDDVFLRATRGLLFIWQGDSRMGSQLYNEAKRMAPSLEIRTLVEQKKQLELGKNQLRQNHLSEAASYLRRALAQDSNSQVHRDQARKLLEAIP